MKLAVHTPLQAAQKVAPAPLASALLQARPTAPGAAHSDFAAILKEQVQAQSQPLAAHSPPQPFAAHSPPPLAQIQLQPVAHAQAQLGQQVSQIHASQQAQAEALARPGAEAPTAGELPSIAHDKTAAVKSKDKERKRDERPEGVAQLVAPLAQALAHLPSTPALPKALQPTAKMPVVDSPAHKKIEAASAQGAAAQDAQKPREADEGKPAGARQAEQPTSQPQPPAPSSEPREQVIQVQLQQPAPHDSAPQPVALAPAQQPHDAAPASRVLEVPNDPTLNVSLMPRAAHLMINSPEHGDVRLHLRVRDGVADVRIDASQASLFGPREAELRTVLQSQGLQLGSFELPQQDASAQRDRADDARDAASTNPAAARARAVSQSATPAASRHAGRIDVEA